MHQKMRYRKQNRARLAPFRLGVSGRAAPRQVLTQDVPADALALGRNRQVTKKDWAKRLRGLKSLRAKKGSR
jgi:bifunctional UDP-N-acetylglucosamine pyrophosphorylase / glucosamine-1-phosphate N-acetyltransferase